MVKVSGFNYYSQVCRGYVGTLARSFVVDGDHISAALCDNLRHSHKLTGLILKLDAQSLLSAAHDKSALDYAVEYRYVDITSRYDADNLFALDRELIIHNSRKRSRARALGNHLLCFNQLENSGCDFVVGYRYDFVNIFLDIFKCMLTRFLDLDTVGNC